MINYDRTKQMNIEEMAKMLAKEIPHGDCSNCNLECCLCIEDKFNDCCINAFYKWLMKEAEE